MRPLRLSLLGRPIIDAGDGLPPVYRKAKALLYFLVVEGGNDYRRDYLADRFWPDLGGEPARAKLRRMVYVINRDLGRGDRPLLLASRDNLRLNPALSLQTDLREVLALADLPANRGNFDMARQLYRGELLDGCDEDFPDLEDWLERQRQFWRDKSLALFRHLASGLQRLGDFAAAEHAWRCCVELSPWDADPRRQLMNLQLLDGRRVEAVAGFEAYCKRLKRDLDLEPEAQAVEAFLALRENASEHDPSQSYSQIAATLSECFPDSVRQRPEILAWHLARSGQFEEAAKAWVAAARQAASRWENALVLRYCQEARQAMLAAGGDGENWRTELAQLEKLASAFYRTKPTEAEPPTKADDGFLQRFIAWAGADSAQGQKASLPLARELVAYCRGHGEDWRLHRAYWVLGHSAFFAGDFRSALDALNRIPIRPFDPPDPVQMFGGSQLAAITLGLLGWTLHFLDEPLAATNHTEMALALARAGQDAPTLILALFFVANLRRWRLEWPEALAAAEEMKAVAEQPTLYAIGCCLARAAQAHLGLPLDPAPDSEFLDTILIHTPMHEITALGLLAEARSALGEREAARRYCRTALASGERLGNFHIAHKLKALLARLEGG